MVRQAARRGGHPGVTAEDKIKLEILAGRLGLSQEDVKARGVRLLYWLLEHGHLREKVTIPIRGGRKVVEVDLEVRP